MDNLLLNNYHVKILTDNEKNKFREIIKNKYMDLSNYKLNLNIVLYNGESFQQYLDNICDNMINILLPVISKIKYHCYIGFKSHYKPLKINHVLTQKYSILNFEKNLCMDLKNNQPITCGILSYLHFEDIDMTQTISIINDKIIYHLQNLFILFKEIIILDDIAKYIFKYLIKLLFNNEK